MNKISKMSQIVKTYNKEIKRLKELINCEDSPKGLKKSCEMQIRNLEQAVRKINGKLEKMGVKTTKESKKTQTKEKKTAPKKTKTTTKRKAASKVK